MAMEREYKNRARSRVQSAPSSSPWSPNKAAPSRGRIALPVSASLATAAIQRAAGMTLLLRPPVCAAASNDAGCGALFPRDGWLAFLHIMRFSARFDTRNAHLPAMEVASTSHVYTNPVAQR